MNIIHIKITIKINFFKVIFKKYYYNKYTIVKIIKK